MSNAEDLLERMKNTPNGWRQEDFVRLYTGFGFKRSGTNHDIYIHKKFQSLRASIPRHNPVKRVYAKEAVKVIAQLKELQQLEASNQIQKGSLYDPEKSENKPASKNQKSKRKKTAP